ncbi:MAG: YdeI/OmpD-associated family protein [Pseudomonadota bacterium]
MPDGVAEYVAFEGTVEPMPWGDKTYTVLPVPHEVVARLGDTKRVEGEIADHPVNLALSRAPVIEGVFLWTGRALLERIGIDPGEQVEVRLRAAPADAVEIPGDLRNALLRTNSIGLWEALSPGKRRGALHQVVSAKRPETRARRIDALIAHLET